MNNPSSSVVSFSTRLAVEVLTRPAGTGPSAPNSAGEWTVLDYGPGFFTLPEGSEAAVRAHTIQDAVLAELVADLAPCAALRYLNLSENRNVTDIGLGHLKALPQLTMLNLSSCWLTSPGIQRLAVLARLEWLDMSYCNRLTDEALRPLRKLAHLKYLNLQGCVKVTNGGVAHLRRPGLEIKK